jgi:predicted transcriptional regulator
MDISKAEWSVMEVLWPIGRATTREVYERIAAQGGDWSFSTVKTLLARLEQKGIVAGTKYGRSVTYEVVVEKPAALKRAFDRFLEHFTGGEVAPLASYLAQAKNLSAKDLEALRAIVDDAEKTSGKGRR